MRLRTLKILGVIIALALSFPLHFVYDKFPCFITSIFSPVNESIWEHMKILFGSILLSGVIQKIIVKVKHLNYNNVCISNVIAAITSIPIFLAIYLPVYYAIGENLFITIILMLVIIIICEMISGLIMKLKPLKLENATILFVIITYGIFTLLTYYPPNNMIFLDPTNLIYGIKK